MSDHSEEQSLNPEQPQDPELHQPRLNEVAQKFLNDLDEERQRLEDSFPLCSFLIEEAIERLYSTGRIPGKEYYADVYKQKPIKITQKVFVPVKQYPKFNFVGKILGPKGNSLRRLEEETQCRIAIKGRNSMRNRSKEEEMRNSQDPRYAHLNKDLFVEVSTVATPAEGYARVAYALAEIRKYLVPDKNDEVSHEQLREMMEIDPSGVKNKSTISNPYYKYAVSKKTIMPGAPKYLNLIKPTNPYSVHEQFEDEDEKELTYDTRGVSKRPIPAGYELVKAKTPPLTPYKRPKATAVDPKIKRLRETPVKNYKTTPYGIETKK